MATQRKMDTVSELTTKVGKAKSMIFVDYRGIKHKQLETMRRAVKKADGEFMVAKNRLMLRVLGDNGAAMREVFNDSTATLFSYGDEVAPLKEMLKFFKEINVGKAKGGLLGDKQMTAEEVGRLASLPGKQVLLGKLVGQLNAPIQGLHYALQWNLNKFVWALDAVKNKKTV